MASKAYDAIVVGAGHNGLVTAAYLAKAGLKVLVCEKNDYIGGATVSRELHKGFFYSNCSYVCSLLRPEIMRDLDLAGHGLQVIPYESGAVFTRDGDALSANRNHEVNRREFARFSACDAEAYDRYSTFVLRQCRLMRQFLLRTPADPASLAPRDLGEMLYLGRTIGALAPEDIGDTIRFWSMSIADFLDEYFDSEVIKAYLAVSAIIGTALGPRSPGSAYVLLHHYMGDVDGSIGAWGFARGGMGSVAKAIAGALQASGGEIRTGAGVSRVICRNRKARGVRLDSGEEIAARLVVSSCDVKRTYLKLIEREDLSPSFIRKVERFKIRGSSGKVNIALDGLPRFPALADDSPCYRGDLHFTDSIDRIERAYDDWKAGRFSRDPMLDVLIPTQLDPTMVPPGKHYMTCFAQYCPPLIEGREWSNADRDAFGRTVIDQIASYSPNFKSLILHAEVRSPRELEAEVGLTEGNIFHGELTFDQLLFNRPFPGYAQYRGALRNFYMCGSSTHPGGGVMGAPGRNAAAEILRDLGKPATMSDAYAVL